LQEPQQPAQIERRYIDQIIEEPDGCVILKFRSLCIRADPAIPGASNFRRSFSDYSCRSEPLDHLQRYRFREPILEPVPDPSSPTSLGIGAVINILTKPSFTIDWTVLKENYYSPQNTSLRLCFKQIDRSL